MALTKNRKKALELVDVDKTYSLKEAAGILKQMPTMKRYRIMAALSLAARFGKTMWNWSKP